MVQAKGLARFLVLCCLIAGNSILAADNPPSKVEAVQLTNAEFKEFTAHLISQLTNAGSGSPTNSPVAPSEADLQTKTTNAPAVLDDKHKLAIGDRISYRILEDEEDPKQLIVSDLGDLEFPYIGRVAAENKTCKQLAADIKAALEKDYYYEATVVVAVDFMAKTRGRVYLVGAIQMPGPQEILTDETLTLSKAILRCGGFTEFANKKSVKITRKTGPSDSEKQTFIVNVGQIYDNGKLEKDIPLEPGDMILIPDRKIRF